MTGKKELSSYEIASRYREKGISEIGSHFILHRCGDASSGRSDDTYGNCHPDFNKNSVFIEVLCDGAESMSPEQVSSLSGMVSILETRYPEAELLDLTL